MPLVSRTRATLRSAEFGFLGVCVNTRTHTPRFCGLLCNAGLFVLLRTASRPLRTSWLIVGTVGPLASKTKNNETRRARACGGVWFRPRPGSAMLGAGNISPIAELSHVDRNATHVV